MDRYILWGLKWLVSVPAGVLVGVTIVNILQMQDRTICLAQKPKCGSSGAKVVLNGKAGIHGTVVTFI